MSAPLFGFAARDLDEAFERVSGPMAKLDGARLFVTGGTGFVGRWLMALLDHARARAGLGFEAVALSRDSSVFRARHPEIAARRWLSFVDDDARDFRFPHGAFTHVIHAATDTSVEADRRPTELADTIVEGTRRALAFAGASGARRFLYVSSGAVYGATPPGVERLREDHAGAPDPLDPRAAYGNSKRFAETLCGLASRAGAFDAVVARVFAAVGPGLPLDAHFAVGNFVRDAMAGRDIVVLGDGTPLRSYLYAADLAAWLVALLVEGEPNAAYNVGSDEAVSIADLAAAAQRALGGRAGVTILGKPSSGAPRGRYVPDIERARAGLGLDAWTPLDEAIRRTAEHEARTAPARERSAA